VQAELQRRLSEVDKAAEDDKEKARSIAASIDLSDLDAFQGDLFTEYLATPTKDSGKQFLLEIGVPRDSGMFNQLNVRAVASAKDRAATLVSQIDEATRNEIREVITTGLTEGMSAQDVSDYLQETYSFSEVRADMIARTENANANNQGVLEGMRELQEQGVKIKKGWNPDALACPICVENGDAGFIELDDVFPDYSEAPPAHPNCRCNMISEMQDD